MLLHRDTGERIRCAGTDLADTQHWLRAVLLACDADGVDHCTFSDEDDDERKDDQPQ